VFNNCHLHSSIPSVHYGYLFLTHQVETGNIQYVVSFSRAKPIIHRLLSLIIVFSANGKTLQPCNATQYVLCCVASCRVFRYKRVLLMRNTKSTRNLTFQLAMSSDVMKRLRRVSKESSRVPGTLQYPLSYPAPHDKLFEIARLRPLRSSKVVQ